MESAISTMEKMIADAIDTVDPMDDVYLANAIIQANKNGKFPSYGMAVTSGLLAKRDAAIRAESAELLRVCGEALKAAQSIKSLVQSIERGEDWEGGEPSLGTCRSLGRIKSISDEATTALAALKDAGVME